MRTCCANRKVTYDGRPVKEILTGNAELNATIPETIFRLVRKQNAGDIDLKMYKKL